RVHGRRAYAVRRREPAPLRAAALQPRVPALQRGDAAPREAGDRLPRGAFPRHREGPRRGPLRARRGRCGGVLPGARHEPLRRAARRVARAQSPVAFPHRAEEGPARPQGHRRVRARGRRRDTPRLSLRAHRRRRPRHESEDLELVEGHAVLRALPAHETCAPARALEPDRQRRADPRDADARRAAARGARSRARALAADLVELHRGVFPASSPGRDRVAYARARRGARLDVGARRRRPGRRRGRRRRDGLRAEGAALVHAFDGRARRARAHDRRRAHRADLRDAEPRYVPYSRERRQPDRRTAPPRRDPSAAREDADEPASAAAQGQPTRAAPGAHVLDARSGLDHERRDQRTHRDRARRRRPPRPSASGRESLRARGHRAQEREDRHRRRAGRGRLLRHDRGRPAARRGAREKTRSAPQGRVDRERSALNAAKPHRAPRATRGCRAAILDAIKFARPISKTRGREELPMTNLSAIIDAGWERRAEITPKNVDAELRDAIEEAINGLDTGRLRVAEKKDGEWTVHQWLKKAVLLSFRIRDNQVVDGGFTKFYDKVPLKFDGFSNEDFASQGARVVPHAVVRRGAYVAPDVVLMPSYVNIGAYV